MNDDELIRYSRQIMLPQIDVAGQQKLLDARVLVIGAGGLGSPAAMYLAASGIGRLVICDDDVVELSNLQRQLLHHDNDIGSGKAASAAGALIEINPAVGVTVIDRRMSGEELAREAGSADVVLDCSDNFETRFAVNAACVAQQTPLVSGAAVRLAGQLAVFDMRIPGSPCYACLYREGGEVDQTCAENGVLAPVVGVIGTLQALEAIRVITGLGESQSGWLLLFDALHQEWRRVELPRDPDCAVCGHRNL